ncbi:dihydroxyacetone kinase phosphoryl donor subunit DhaM [Actinomadura alba]|uniref:phosphoenolpyruvate--glycerone phosphotransferase n=1 Tax=Actinomadura alba TaxID=406431 RepID=A0ABR7LJI6_9ACTN|nr:dihydroxyacetone kinase phosphoryl donor subunit DhaM [Actinomadura alba]MBC6464637.1 PTS fructose transporter subunit IIA [Actinomadura alba]
MDTRGTVGIVVISHSRMLAEGVVELARELGGGRVLIEPAGGDASGGLGTSIELVEQAVRAADSGAGVVLLADVGSSVLTAKSFVADCEADEAIGTQEVVLADAPLVEGAVAAVATAAGGADLATVVAAAGEAYDFRKS